VLGKEEEEEEEEEEEGSFLGSHLICNNCGVNDGHL